MEKSRALTFDNNGNVIRYILVGKNKSFTISEIFDQCKKMGIDDPALVYRILDDLCKKEIIIPSNDGYQPAYLSDVG